MFPLCHATNLPQNREDALSSAGQEQVLAACEKLKASFPTAVRFSLAAVCIDTANIVQRELKMGRDRVLPEYTFLDPRAVGAWDMRSMADTLPAVFSMDNDEAGRDGLGGRPPANDDGTPNETLADQAVRLRQLMSLLESQYSGDTILLIFPDGTGPALLSAMIAGIPYNRVHELEFAPGEVRLDVTLQSTLQLWKTKQREEGDSYQAVLAQGRENLKKLRANEYVNLKDKKLEEEQVAIEKQMQQKDRQRKAAEDRERKERLERQRQLDAEKEERRKQQAADGSEGVPRAAVGAAAAAAAGGFWFLGNSNKTLVSSEKDEKPSEVLEVTSNTTTSVIINDADAESIASSMHEAASKPQRVNGDPKGRYPPLEEEILDPREAAEKAMQEYLNQDDGGEDWLLSVSEIMNEPSDDEGYDEKDSL
jgi:broad specificity phosphatase PhoE